ncbi:MAG: hypothetical protein R3D83_02155 [Caenibius sp.]
MTSSLPDFASICRAASASSALKACPLRRDRRTAERQAQFGSQSFGLRLCHPATGCGIEADPPLGLRQRAGNVLWAFHLRKVDVACKVMTTGRPFLIGLHGRERLLIGRERSVLEHRPVLHLALKVQTFGLCPIEALHLRHIIGQEAAAAPS